MSLASLFAERCVELARLRDAEGYGEIVGAEAKEADAGSPTVTVIHCWY
jgi:hypothetical protein